MLQMLLELSRACPTQKSLQVVSWGALTSTFAFLAPSQLWKAREPGTLLVWVWRVCDSWQETLQLSQGHAGAEGDARLV